MSKHKVDLLLVEDDPQLRLLMRTIFTQCGYIVRSAHDGFSGLEEMRCALPDMVLSDLYMPGMSGFEFLAEVRKNFPQIPLIAMSSAYTGTEVPAGVVADAFYEKASSIQNLLALVEAQKLICASRRKVSLSEPVVPRTHTLPAAMRLCPRL